MYLKHGKLGSCVVSIPERVVAESFIDSLVAVKRFIAFLLGAIWGDGWGTLWTKQ